MIGALRESAFLFARKALLFLTCELASVEVRRVTCQLSHYPVSNFRPRRGFLQRWHDHKSKVEASSLFTEERLEDQVLLHASHPKFMQIGFVYFSQYPDNRLQMCLLTLDMTKLLPVDRVAHDAISNQSTYRKGKRMNLETCKSVLAVVEETDRLHGTQRLRRDCSHVLLPRNLSNRSSSTLHAGIILS